MALDDYPPARFARFQATQDLRALMAPAQPSPYPYIAGLLPGLPPTAMLEMAARDGLPLEADTVAFHPALSMAATQPERNMAAFVAATAYLLADRLLGGAGDDDLYWHYDAHAGRYAALPHDVRAVILTGFAVLHGMGEVTLDAPPTAEARAARPERIVRAVLAKSQHPYAPLYLAALNDGSARAEAELLWREEGAALRNDPVLAGAARHLYETRPGFDPYRDWPMDRIAARGIAIPFPCALPVPDGAE